MSNELDDRDELEVLASEFMDRLRGGEAPDIEAYAAAHPELFYTDRTHLRQSGAEFYAASIYEQIRLALETP